MELKRERKKERLREGWTDRKRSIEWQKEAFSTHNKPTRVLQDKTARSKAMDEMIYNHGPC